MARRRKGWDNLSPAQQLRYARAGITPESYQQGASLAKARGHGSEEKENAIRRIRRDWKEWNLPTEKLSAFVTHYGVYDSLMISGEKLKAAEKDPTAVQFMRALWNTKPADAPKSWYYYHPTPK